MTIETIICPLCDEGELTLGTYADDFKHNNGTIHVEGLECCICNTCGADPVLPEQVRRNHLIIADAKRVKEGLLIGLEVRAARESLGLTQKEASELFGGGANSFSKYERGDVIQSLSVDRWLRVAMMVPEIIDVLKIVSGKEAHHEDLSYRESKPIKVSQNLRGLFAPKDSVVVSMQDWAQLNKRDAA
jgi:HTH-type transcriptional regulator/antitoxin MqsA